MKVIAGVLLGFVGYAAWTLSEPAEGEPPDVRSRLERLKTEWRGALLQGKAAGEHKRVEMEREFGQIFHS